MPGVHPFQVPEFAARLVRARGPATGVRDEKRLTYPNDVIVYAYAYAYAYAYGLEHRAACAAPRRGVFTAETARPCPRTPPTH